MEENKKPHRPVTAKRLNKGSGIGAACFLLYLAAMALQWAAVAGIIAAAGTVIAGWTCVCAGELRQKDKEAVSYNLLWGSGALTLLLIACAAAGFKVALGL
ncbi:MAG: hypothetical protein E7443_05690 [Ruminococcaceae bacterium]|nr:hypothetical protein [Oscillospiraceae bacterium]